MSEVGYVYFAPSGEQIGTISDSGIELVPDEETFSADAPMSFSGSLTMTATIDGMDEDMMRKLSGWTVLCAEDPDTRYKTLHRVYTWDYKKMEGDGSHECLVHRPTLILPPDIPDAERVVGAWLEMDEVPGEDYAYVTADEPDVLRTMSALDMACTVGRYWLEHDL